MTQQIHRKSSKKRNQKHTHLGPAPNAIYDLEREINQFTKTDDQKIEKMYQCNNIQEAKQALQQGHTIKYNLSKNITALDIVNIAKSLGLPTLKIKKVLGSSMVIKKLIDGYVSNLKSSNKPYYGYLKYCKQVTALQCNDKLVSQVRIKLDLDYNKFVTQDDKFKNKFINELSRNIFKCSNDKIDIVHVRQGSIVVVAGIPVLAVVAVGLVVIGIGIGLRYVYRRYQRNRSGNDNSVSGNENVYVNDNNNGSIHNSIVADQSPPPLVFNDETKEVEMIAFQEKQEFHPRQKVMINKANRGRQYLGIVKGFEYGDDEDDDDKVIIKYDDDAPSDVEGTEVFSLTDQSLIALEPGQDPTIEAYIHINQKEANIIAKKCSFQV